MILSNAQKYMLRAPNNLASAICVFIHVYVCASAYEGALGCKALLRVHALLLGLRCERVWPSSRAQTYQKSAPSRALFAKTADCTRVCEKRQNAP